MNKLEPFESMLCGAKKIHLFNGQQQVETNSEETNSCGPQSSMAQCKRKEKARIAARARRSQEANIIMEMAIELHISQEKLRRIDKATIVKLAIDYIKAYEVLCQPQPQPLLAPANTMIDITSASSLSHDAIIRQQTQHNNDYEKEKQLNVKSECINRQIYNEEQVQERMQEQENRPIEEEEQQHQVSSQQSMPYSAPKLTTASIFAPKTRDNANSYFLMIERNHDGESSFVLKPDTEIQDEDDLTHLAPQAGDISISFETDPLDGIPIDDLLVPSPPRAPFAYDYEKPAFFQTNSPSMLSSTWYVRGPCNT